MTVPARYAQNIVKPAQANFVKMLVVGEVGIGKTTFLGSAQLDDRTSPMLLLDFEGGTASLAGLDIDVWRVRDWTDYERAYEMLEAKDHAGYKSVGIDSVSETHVFALLNILEEEASARAQKGQRTSQLQEGDYGIALIQMRRLLRSFRDLDMHVFFTALPQDSVEPGIGVVKEPSLAGKLAREISGLMSAVGFLAWGEKPGVTPQQPPRPGQARQKNETRIMALKNYPKLRAKARTPWGDDTIPDEVYDPTVTNVFDALKVAKPE